MHRGGPAAIELGKVAIHPVLLDLAALRLFLGRVGFRWLRPFGCFATRVRNAHESQCVDIAVFRSGLISDHVSSGTGHLVDGSLYSQIDFLDENDATFIPGENVFYKSIMIRVVVVEDREYIGGNGR